MESIIQIAELTIGSTVFANKDFLPAKYTCEGENVNPPITIENIPSGTKSLTLIIDDPDAPNGVFDHWVIWNIRPMEMIIENSRPGTEGKNSFGRSVYHGPCPPAGGPHRYFFRVYALDILLDLKRGSDKKALEKAMHGHIIAAGEIVAMYQKTKYKNL
jgi:Raf kinase inhibitor-like YbhB/YbcL family protein